VDGLALAAGSIRERRRAACRDRANPKGPSVVRGGRSMMVTQRQSIRRRAPGEEPA
jgi:hypothetical protein